jgi:YD repeat-containing protein
VGNRSSLIAPGGPTAYSYDAANHLLSAGATSYTWDANGNLAKKTTGGAETTFTYDFENRLTSVTHPDTSITAFTYYPDGAWLSITNRSGQMTRFFHDGSNTLRVDCRPLH